MKLRVAGVAIALFLLLPAGLPRPAHARGFGGHAMFFAGRLYPGLFRLNWWWRYGYWRYGWPASYWPANGAGYAPSYGGFVDDMPAPGGFGYPMPAPVQFVARQLVPMPAPICQPSVEVVTVPAEEGGTRQITIRRCMR